jgi:hypothetical protein
MMLLILETIFQNLDRLMKSTYRSRACLKSDVDMKVITPRTIICSATDRQVIDVFSGTQCSYLSARFLL